MKDKEKVVVDGEGAQFFNVLLQYGFQIADVISFSFNGFAKLFETSVKLIVLGFEFEFFNFHFKITNLLSLCPMEKFDLD